IVTDEEGILAQIANEMQSVSSIVSTIRERKKARPSTAGPLVPPGNPVEETLVNIWSDVLGVEPIGIRDNFFDFGGQSLRATRVLTRVRTELGVELGLTALFKTPTIEAMAALHASAFTAFALILASASFTGRTNRVADSDSVVDSRKAWIG
ncbi:MAG: hypothetical protein DMG93_20585, partial [Acidobacteria bacterium]